jgi:hypothetical protein
MIEGRILEPVGGRWVRTALQGPLNEAGLDVIGPGQKADGRRSGDHWLVSGIPAG